MNLLDIYTKQQNIQKTKKAFLNQLYSNTSDIHLNSVIDELTNTLVYFKNLPGTDFNKNVTADETDMTIDLSYEIVELERDIEYLGSKSFRVDNIDCVEKLFENRYPNFNEQIKKGCAYLNNIKIDVFITDRDGTVNNYCARYGTSIQSIYNAVCLNNFADNIDLPVILTSAPLKNPGILDVNVIADNSYIQAASKGREFYDLNNNVHSLPIEPEKQQILDLFNENLSKLLKENTFTIFSIIGSGLQFKFGQTTIARQDIFFSINESKSLLFLERIKKLVADIDPDGNFLILEDTGKDIEIILTINYKSDAAGKDFDKGDGVRFIAKELPFDMTQKSILVCGDTGSDIPMLAKAVELSQDVYCIFVTTDNVLKEKVKNVLASSIFVDNPDTLITILNRTGLKE